MIARASVLHSIWIATWTATTDDSGADLKLWDIGLVVVSHWHALLLILLVSSHIVRIAARWQLIIASALVLGALAISYGLADVELVWWIAKL